MCMVGRMGMPIAIVITVMNDCVRVLGRNYTKVESLFGEY